jgi:hypothetical protein
MKKLYRTSHDGMEYWETWEETPGSIEFTGAS